ncbi:MAG TPA: MFS transporter [Asanoa sp.]
MAFTSTTDSRWSDVSIAAGARGLSVAGDFLAATALALALQDSGAGGLAVSGLWIAATLPIALLAPVTGRLADRVDSRTLLVTAGLAQATVCLALAYVSGPVAVVGLVALLACGLALTQPVFAALVPSMVHPDDLPKASAIGQTATMAGSLAGPALAGFLVGQFGTRPPLLVDAATYLAIVVAGLLLRTRRGRVTPVSADQRPAAAWRLRGDPLVFAMLLAIAGVIAGVAGVNVIEVFFIRETLGASPTAYGLVNASWTAGMVAGSWVFARLIRRWTEDGSLAGSMLGLLGGCCLVVAIAAAAPSVAFVVPLWLAGGLMNGGEGVLSTVLLARRVPERFRGRAFAALNAAVQGAALVGYLVGGLLLEGFAPRPLVAVTGVIGALVVVAVAVPVRRVIRRERAAGLVTPAAVG